MTWLLDIIIAVIIAVSILLGVKRGFVKTAVSAAAFLVAIIVTAIFTSPLSGALKSTGMGAGIENATEEFISDIMLDNSLNTEELVNGENEEFNNFVGVSGSDNQELKEWYEENAPESEETAKELLAKKLAEPIVNIIVTLVAVIILYVGTQILMSVTGSILSKVFRLPGLKTCDTLLGGILGTILAFVRVLLFCFIMNVLIKNADYLGIDWISDLNPSGTLLFNFFKNINLFSFFI